MQEDGVLSIMKHRDPQQYGMDGELTGRVE